MYDTITIEAIDKLIMEKEKLLYLQRHEHKKWLTNDGKWWKTYVIVEGERKQVKRHTEEELNEYLYEFYKSQENNPTVDDIFVAWTNWKLDNQDICKGTYDRYYIDYNRFFGEAIRQVKISAITEDELDIFIRRTIIDNKLSRKAFSNFRTLVYGVFKYAKKKHYTDINIVEFFNNLELGNRIFKKPKRNAETSVFHDDESEKLLLYLTDHPTIENLGLLFCFYTGIRVGELAALKFTDISNGIARIQRSEIVYKDDANPGKQIHEIVEHTKTEAGEREVVLSQEAINILTVAAWNKTSDYIFAKDGHRINKTAYNRYLSNACKAVDIPERTMHKIRRTVATKLLDAGLEDSIVAEQMGHSDVSTTRKYYYYGAKNKDYKAQRIREAITY